MSDQPYDEKTDEILGITRCARCGQRLEGEIECPFCAAMRGFDGVAPERKRVSLWVYITALFMTFPLSLPWLLMSRRLSFAQKAVVFVAGLVWMSTLVWFL